MDFAIYAHGIFSTAQYAKIFASKLHWIFLLLSLKSLYFLNMPYHFHENTGKAYTQNIFHVEVHFF